LNGGRSKLAELFQHYDFRPDFNFPAKEMNHSPRFCSVVGQLYPDYRVARDELKALASLCPHW
jgi:hypothetical protein